MTDPLDQSISSTIRSHARLEKRRLKGTQSLSRGEKEEGKKKRKGENKITENPGF